MRRKVVVTGLGALTCLGSGMDECWRKLIGGISCVRRISKFDPEGYPSQIAGQIDHFDPLEFLDPKEIKRTELFIQYAIAAADLAVRDADIRWDTIDRERAGVYIGSGIGGISEVCGQQEVLMSKGPRRVSAFFIPNAIANLASGHVSIRYQAKGPNSAVCTACATGSHAIGDAMKIIERGDADLMIAGGSEAPVMPLAVAGFCAMRALSTRNDDPATASRPFDRDRDGFIIAEGSACVILESEEHAVKRGARIYCELIGYGMTGDAHHLSAPAPGGEGAARCMRVALADAGVTGNQVDYINAHGTSTLLNDKFETLAIKAVFGDRAYRIPINSTKSMVGHILGTAGAFECAVMARSILEGKIHPTANYHTPDPDCDLDYVTEGSRDIDINYAISNSFGFGGTNAVLVAHKYAK
ncbi:beta-ketoacyl-ACP synthase II [bacterium]|nr:beta-ketoacyl-ACP synthase II [candidate division CSSED10-310 bacterium]